MPDRRDRLLRGLRLRGVHRRRHAPGWRGAGGHDGAAGGLGLAISGIPAASGAPGAGDRRAGLNVAAALAGRPAVVGHIRAGLFPRDMTPAPDGTLLVSNFDSGQVEAVDVATVPGTPGGAG